MTFKELKRLAKEKNFSRRWTSKVIRGHDIFVGNLRHPEFINSSSCY
jgi:hypothetical protein